MVLNPVKIEARSHVCFGRWKAMLLLPPGYQFKNLDSSKIMLFGLFLLETFERTAVTLNLCSHEHQGRVGPFFGSGFIFSVSSMPAWEAHSHTQNDVAMPGGVQDQLQELYCDCTARGVLRPHTNESRDMDYLKDPSQL